jgi:hypothetical protein
MYKIIKNCAKWFRDNILKYLSDEAYLKLITRFYLGRKIDLKNPITFNEKLNWLKLHDRDPRYTKMADKYAAKDFVSSLLGTDENIVPCLGVYESFDDIDFSTLPQKFVIKTTHDSSGVIVCRDKSKLDIEEARQKINKSLKRDFFLLGREWPYKDVPRRVIVDQFLDDHSGKELIDYKFWCFNGEPKVFYLTNKGVNVYENFYDMDFNPLYIDHGFPRRRPEWEKPEAFDEMKILAGKISERIPFVRVDFFYVDGHIYFGECTFYDWGGLRPFKSKEWDNKLGEWLVLPEKSKKLIRKTTIQEKSYIKSDNNTR